MAESTIPQAEHDRTVSHLNKDHAEDLSLYLRHYNKVPTQDAADAEILSLDLECMIVRAGPSRTIHKIAYNPPLRNWADRRAVLVDMSRAARAANTADLIRWPALAPDLLAGATVGLLFAAVAAAQLGYLAPGTALWSNPLLASFPGGPAALARISMWVGWPVLAIHVVEVVVLATRLPRYGMSAFSYAGIFWSASVFFEGVGAFNRFNKMVKELNLEAKGKGGKSN